MNRYDFDTIIDRRGTNCLKYDQAERRGYDKNILPLWIADMDFKTAPSVIDRLHKTVSHGIYGYSQSLDDYYEAAAGWFEKYFDWKPEQRWLVKTPGVVFALAMAIKAYTNVGDSVLIQTPVYYPFYQVINNNDRKLVENELVNVNGHYEIDFDDLERKIKDNDVKLFILCSPHNPVGRVWTVTELKRIGEICNRYDVIIVSDEIHCDFVFPGYKHTVFTQACPEYAHKSVICTSASKTFNLAGLQLSNIWISDAGLRRRFRHQVIACGYTEFSIMGISATKEAYTNGQDWHEESWEYIQDNFVFLRDFIKNKLPQIKLIEPEGTYFAWLDFSQLGLNKVELNKLIIEEAQLWFDSGHIFGESSEQYQRIVMAAPRKLLKQALEQLECAVNKKLVNA